MMLSTYRFVLMRFFTLSILLTSAISQVHAADVLVSDAYARAVPAGHPNSAAFMILENTSATERKLVNAKSGISKAVELHTHKMENGMMRMRRIDSITVKAKSKTELKPGGLHVMFIGLKQELNVGDNVELELVFDDNSNIKLSVPVKKVAGMKMKHNH